MLFAQLSGTSKLVAVLNNAAHAPAFGLVALLVHNSLLHLRLRRRLAAAFLAAIGLGILVEVIQGLTGRDASWFDVWTDALGAACALALSVYFRAKESDDRRGPSVALALAVAASLAVLYPVGKSVAAYGLKASSRHSLMTFDRPLSLYFIETQGVEVERRELPREWATEADQKALLVTVLQGKYPGINLTEPFRDWRLYEMLKLDVTNPCPDSLPLTVRVHDRTHDNRISDRFNRTVEVAASARTIVSIRLADVTAGPEDRNLDLSDVAGLILFTSGTGARPGRKFYVTRVWLD